VRVDDTHVERSRLRAPSPARDMALIMLAPPRVRYAAVIFPMLPPLARRLRERRYDMPRRHMRLFTPPRRHAAVYFAAAPRRSAALQRYA